MTYITGGAVQLSGTTSLIDLPGISTPSLSASNHGKVYFDSTSFTFKASLNGGAYSTFGVTPPGGANTQLQFNNAGAFGGTANITTDGTNLTLSTGTLNANVHKATSGSLTLSPQSNSATGIIMTDAGGAHLMEFDTSVHRADFINPAGGDILIDPNGGRIVVNTWSTAVDATLYLLNPNSANNWYVNVNGPTSGVGGGSGSFAIYHATGGNTPFFINTSNVVNLSNPLPIASGGTGTSTGAINQLTGDVTAGPGNASQAATLATVNGNVGSFTAANITVNAKGLITAASNGSAGVGGSGTTNVLPRFTASTTLGDSGITDNGNGSTLVMASRLVNINFPGSTANPTSQYMLKLHSTAPNTNIYTYLDFRAAANYNGAVQIATMGAGSNSGSEFLISGVGLSNGALGWCDKVVVCVQGNTAAIQRIATTDVGANIARVYTATASGGTGSLFLNISGNAATYQVHVKEVVIGTF